MSAEAMDTSARNNSSADPPSAADDNQGIQALLDEVEAIEAEGPITVHASVGSLNPPTVLPWNSVQVFGYYTPPSSPESVAADEFDISPLSLVDPDLSPSPTYSERLEELLNVEEDPADDHGHEVAEDGKAVEHANDHYDEPDEIDSMTSNAASSRQGYHQDYIARVRYANGLPPPDMPPKLLQVPGEGLSSGQYTSPSFASRLAREQPLNIEADAELGMPLDLVGMPGIFDGDESSIQAPDQPPAPHPRDKPLLRPLSSLGKPTSMSSGVSFLRRTEYISAESGRTRFDSSASNKPSKAMLEAQKRRERNAEREDPVNIVRAVEKSFDVANPDSAYTGPDTSKRFRGHPVTQAERDAWAHPKHPTKDDVLPDGIYPILPDLSAFPDSGGYIVVTYTANPLKSGVIQTDTRAQVALLRPKEPQRAEVMAAYQAQISAHQADPSKPEPGPPPFDYDLYLPKDPHFVEAIKKKYNIRDPQRDDPNLFTHANKETGEKNFRYDFQRTYETASGVQHKDRYQEVALTLYDPSTESTTDGGAKKQKGAYYYPVLQKLNLRPRRQLNLSLMGSQPAAADMDKVDFLDIVPRDPDQAELERREGFKKQYDRGPAPDEDDADAPGEAE
ncbi:MAG: hypothetical protein M1838_001931 [Thelocarpon superellum]|nr:MAG: hypothetical protein M1838_001931 [Thelocarpon superellum]